MLGRQLELERKLAVLVEDAYSLTPEERTLLLSTQPIRDPLDGLEAKIRWVGEQDKAAEDLLQAEIDSQE